MGTFVLYMIMMGGSQVPFGTYNDFNTCSNLGNGIFQADMHTYEGYSCIQQQAQ